MAIQEAGVSQRTQHTYILALTNQQFLSFYVELSQLYTLLPGEGCFEALKCDIVYGLIRYDKSKGYFLDSHLHFLHGQTFEILFTIYSHSQMAFFIFLNSHHKEEDILFILLIMQHVFMRKLMI